MSQPQPAESLDLDAIQARCDAATPGPWWNDGHEIYQGEHVGIPAMSTWIGETCTVSLPDYGDANGAFLANARQDVPSLLTRVQELEAENQQLVAAVDQLTTVLEVVTAQHAKAVTARDKAKLRAKTSDDIASAEREVFQAAIRDLGGDPVQVQNLYAQLQSRTRQWREALADLDVRDAEITQLRAEIQAQGDALVRVRDQQVGFRADGMREAAAMLRRHCPNHGDADTCLISCHCPAADEIDRDANALAARTTTD